MATQRFLSFARDTQSFNTFLRNPAPIVVDGQLATSVEQTYTIPSDYPFYAVIFGWEQGNNIYVNINNTAAVPSGSFSTGGSEVNPVGYWLIAGSVIHVITDDTSVNMSMSLYPIPGTGNTNV